MSVGKFGLLALVAFLGSAPALAELDTLIDIHGEVPLHDHRGVQERDHQHGDSDDHHHSQDGSCQHQNHCCCQHPSMILAWEGVTFEHSESIARYSCRLVRCSVLPDSDHHFHPPRA